MSTTKRLILGRAVPAVLCLLVLAATATAGEALWQTNFEKAKAQAKAENKLLLVDFTGSDWCGWCIKLKQEVFDKPEFQTAAPKQFVLVELDYPRQKQLPDELKEQNAKLVKEYKVQGYPTILLLEPSGQVVAKTGYRAGGPEKYVAHLGDFVKAFQSIQKLRGDLAKVQGLDRAKLLDELITAYSKLDNEVDEIAGWSKEIITLDADNKAGLKLKYQVRSLLAEAAKLKEGRKFDEAKLVLDKVVALPGITGEQKQEAYFAQGECFFYSQNFAGVVNSLKQALAAAPTSEKAGDLKGMIERFAPMAEAEEALTKGKAALDKAQGLDRAKVLDGLVEAQSKLAQMGLGRDQAAQVDKWCQEIIKLDPENKAGLKNKYEVRTLISEAESQMRTQNTKEAQAAVAKVLALPDLKPDQRQDALLIQAQCQLTRQEIPDGIATLKKALEAAPEGAKAPLINALLRRAESMQEKPATKPAPKAKPAKPTASK